MKILSTKLILVNPNIPLDLLMNRKSMSVGTFLN